MKQSSWEQWPIADLGQETDKMNQQHLVESESKEASQDTWGPVKRAQESTLKRLSLAHQ